MNTGSDSGRLKGKNLVIIGGTTGLGLSAALAFTAEGATVTVAGRNPESGAAAGRALGETGLVRPGDATRPETAVETIRAAADRFGPVHGIYHVAGGSGRKMGDGPLDQISDEGWALTLNLNLTSVFYTNRAAARYFLAEERGGSVLNLGSVLGFSPSPRFFGTHAYAAAKAAIEGLTRASASFYASRNIRFNVLAPALVETPMAERAVSNPVIVKFVSTKQPLDGGRVGRVTDLDAAAVYFMSDDSKYVTGQVLAVDGGWSVSEGQIPAGD